MAGLMNVDGLSLTERLNRKAAFRMVKNRADKLEKLEDEALIDLMDAGESRNAMIDGRVVARIEKTKGSAGNRFKIKDPLAYGAWLHANGYDDNVYAAPLPTDVAKTKSIEKTKGSAGNRFKIKDPLAYGAWLHANGYDDNVYAAPLPTDVAKTKSFIERVVSEHEGELPDGVEVDGGRPAALKITVDKDEQRGMFERTQLPPAMNLMLENGGVL